MQWCQHLETDYRMDPQICQSLDGPPLHLSSKLHRCNSLDGRSSPNSKKGQSIHILVFVPPESNVLIVSYILGIPSFWANIHLSVSTYHVCSFFFPLFFPFFKLGIFLIYIFNVIPKVPHTQPPNPLPTHCPFLALAFPCTGAYKVCKSNGPLFAVMTD